MVIGSDVLEANAHPYQSNTSELTEVASIFVNLVKFDWVLFNAWKRVFFVFAVVKED